MTEICRLCGEAIAGLALPMATDDCRKKIASIIPELDAYNINSPMMCNLCSNSLSDAHAFKQHCLHTNKTMPSLNKQPKVLIPTMESDYFRIKLEDIDLSDVKHEDNEITYFPKLFKQMCSCAYCGKTYKSSGVLTQHVRYVHLQDFRRQTKQKNQIITFDIDKVSRTNGVIADSIKDNNIVEHADCLNSRKFLCRLNLHTNQILELRDLDSKLCELDTEQLENTCDVRIAQQLRVLSQCATLKSGNLDSKLLEFEDDSLENYEVGIDQELGGFSQNRTFESVILNLEPCEYGIDSVNSNVTDNHHKVTISEDLGGLNRNRTLDLRNLDSQSCEFEDDNLDSTINSKYVKVGQELQILHQNKILESQNMNSEVHKDDYNNFDCPESSNEASVLQNSVILTGKKTLDCPSLDSKIYEFDNSNLWGSDKTNKGKMTKKLRSLGQNGTLEFGNLVSKTSEFNSNSSDCSENRKVTRAVSRSLILRKNNALESRNLDSKTRELNDCNSWLPNCDGNSDARIVYFDNSQALNSRKLQMKQKAVHDSSKKRGRPCKASEKNIGMPKLDWDKSQEPKAAHNSFKKSTTDNNKSGESKLAILARGDSTISASNMSIDNSDSLLSIMRTEPVQCSAVKSRKIREAIRPSLYWNRRLFNAELNKLFKQHSDTTCLICEHVTPTMSILHSHLRVHVNFQCNYCVRSFRTCHSVIAHVKVAHKDVPAYPCSICGRLFPNKLSRSDHKNRTHTKKNSSVCSVCRKRVSDVSMSRHMRNHAEANKFVCHLCSKGFLQAGALSNHQYKCLKKW